MKPMSHNPEALTPITSNRWDELKATARRFGARALLIDLASRLLRHLGVYTIEQVFTVTDSPTAGTDSATLLEPEQLRLFRQQGQIHCTDQAIDDVTSGRKICIGVIEQDTLCGYTWYALQPYRHSGTHFAFFDSRYICGYGAFIHPDYRGRQLRAAIVARAICYARSVGKAGVLAAIGWTNFGSIRSAVKIGYRPHGFSYLCRWTDLGIDKSRYHLRTLAAQEVASSVFIGSAISRVTEVAYRETALRLLVDTAKARSPTGRERLKRWLGLSVSTAQWAKQRGIPCIHFSRSEESAIAQRIAQEDIELLFSYTAPILGDAIIQAPTKAAINVHPSLLPDYRGGSPLLWQLLREETATGATVHLLTEGIDQGDILAQVTSPLARGLNREQVFALARTNAAQALSHWLDEYRRTGEIHASPQPRHSRTPFARNMSLATLNEQIDWPTAAPGMLFALARYLGRWPAELMTPPGILQWLPWRASGFETSPRADANTRWQLTPAGLRFYNSQGNLLLRLNLHPLRLLAHLRNWPSLRAKRGTEIYL